MADLTAKAFAIKNQWLNFSLYFVNFMFRTKRNSSRNKVCPHIINRSRLQEDTRDMGGGEQNLQYLGNGETYQTDFIKVNKNDFVKIYSLPQLGVRFQTGLEGTDYKKLYNNPNFNITNQDLNNDYYYFLKGTNVSDSFKYLVSSKTI